MRTLLTVVLAFAVGALLTRAWWMRGEPADPVHVILAEVRTQAIIEHERQVAIWYRSCPEVVGVNPEIFVAWPGKLSYELDLSHVEIERDGDVLRVRTGAVRADEPSVPTDFIDHLSTTPLLNLANEQALINREVARASPIARFLTAYYLRNDPSLQADFRDELARLVERLASALGVAYAAVEVEIPAAEVRFPKLPALELCAGTRAAINGVPFAKVEEGYTIPLRFDAAAASGRAPTEPGTAPGAPRGVIAGVQAEPATP